MELVPLVDGLGHFPGGGREGWREGRREGRKS